ATQAGEHKSGFELYYSSAYDRWVFNQYISDTPDSNAIRAMQAEGRTARGGEWTHLVGVHDTVANQLTLYVNGVEAGRATVSETWYAGGQVQIGAGSYEGAPDSFFPGQIDEVKIFDRPVSADEVRQLFKQSPVIKGRWNFEEASSGTPKTSPDLSEEQNPMSLLGGAKLGAGMIGATGLELDGVDDYAATSTVPIDTGASFTVTAWAQGAAVPKGSAAVVSSEGTTQSAFTLRFVPDAKNPEGLGRWELALPDEDIAKASVKQMGNTEFYDARDWNHLAVVYDGFAKEARLYVNGLLQEVACADGDGNGEADDGACEDLIAWADNVLTFKATKSLQVGRAKTAGSWGEYFPGAVDDVWAFQGALNDVQVEKLAGSWFELPTEVPPSS
ncbi:LamG domain-containing protein, partial [Streptomyces sp. NPDC088124]|uniref:LamG domain-containing protein n=1 Tax=Streptomyces sp. NPDC088124 TaxID=3154654 RepID=UPI003416A243